MRFMRLLSLLSNRRTMMGTLAKELVAVARDLRPKSKKEPFDWHNAFEEVYLQGFRKLERADKQIEELECELKRYKEVKANAPHYEQLWAETLERAENLERELAEIRHAMDGDSN